MKFDSTNLIKFGYPLIIVKVALILLSLNPYFMAIFGIFGYLIFYRTILDDGSRLKIIFPSILIDFLLILFIPTLFLPNFIHFIVFQIINLLLYRQVSKELDLFHKPLAAMNFKDRDEAIAAYKSGNFKKMKSVAKYTRYDKIGL